MKKLARRALAVLFALMVACVALVSLVAWRTLPAYSGNASLAALQAPVEIIRDADAISHVFAATERDAYTALGYVHAQDRLWQMELNRRIASGTLAELLGARALDLDRLFRTLGLRAAAQRDYAALPVQTRAMLDAYADGVNAWLDSDPPRPVELVALGATPARWTPVDSLSVLKLLAWDLSGNFGDELLRLRLSARLSARQLSELFTPAAGGSALPWDALLSAYQRLGMPRALHDEHASAGRSFDAAAAALMAFAPASLGRAVGSNNWAVSGSRSTSGKPLLANDPHLTLSAPSQWYLAHLHAHDGLNVIGASLPSLPGVILGRNERVAWAFTNMAPDTEDLYVERVDPSDPARYVGASGSLPFGHVRERIRVRGEPDVELTVRRTVHGPVISDALEEAQGAIPPGYVLALRWTALLPADQTMSFPQQAARARDVAELRAAAASFHAPAQNIVSADTEGNIAYVGAGRIPRRRDDAELMGLLPSPGWLERFEWAGTLSGEQLPSSSNPVSGRIETANQRAVSADGVTFLGADWGPPYRADRIAALLDAREKHDLESFEAIQRDVHSSLADLALPAMLAALPPAQANEDQAARSLLATWDHRMLANRPEPLIFAAWFRELSRALYEDELGELFAASWTERPELLARVLAPSAPEAAWCDDVRTRAPESCAAVASDALHRALADLRARFGPDLQRWSWGAAHVAEAEHLPFGELPVIGRMFNLRRPRGGDASTIDVGSFELEPRGPDAFPSPWGPGLRLVYDLADLERSQAILNTGQSGNPFSSHYRDMNAAWAEGRYVPLRTDRAEITREALGTLRLEPNRGEMN